MAEIAKVFVKLVIRKKENVFRDPNEAGVVVVVETSTERLTWSRNQPNLKKAMYKLWIELQTFLIMLHAYFMCICIKINVHINIYFFIFYLYNN